MAIQGKKRVRHKRAIQIACVVVLIVVALGVRLAIAGGDWGCFFANDPALCQTVKGLGG